MFSTLERGMTGNGIPPFMQIFMEMKEVRFERKL
jgi:hypothetical protein